MGRRSIAGLGSVTPYPIPSLTPSPLTLSLDLPPPHLVDSKVRGTTLQKLIVDSEVRGTTLQKLIVDSEVRGTTLQKLIVKSEVK